MMKPVRGSERASSKAPKGKKTGEKPNKPGIKTRQRRGSQEEPQPGTSSQIPQPKPQKKKKKGGTVASPKKLKGQEKWKPLTKASITALDNILGLSILSVLAGRRTNKEESQKHLNIVKNRFLSKLAQLSVPIQKQEMSHSSRQHQEETRKSAVGKKILNKLVAQLGAVVGSLEQLEKERDSLEHQCFNLRQLLEQQEERNQQILQLSEQGVLRLPLYLSAKTDPYSCDLSSVEEEVAHLRHSADSFREDCFPFKTTQNNLEEQMVCLVRSGHSVTTARRLAKTLQTSGPVQDAQTLLERAYRHADRLITPPTAVSQ